MKTRRHVSIALWAMLLVAGRLCAAPPALSDADLAVLFAGSYGAGQSTPAGSAAPAFGSARVRSDRIDRSAAQDRLSQRLEGESAAAVSRQERADAPDSTPRLLEGAQHSRHRSATTERSFSGGVIPSVITFTGTQTKSTTTTDSEGNPVTRHDPDTTFTESLRVGIGIAGAGEAALDARSSEIQFEAKTSVTVTLTGSVKIDLWLIDITVDKEQTVTVGREVEGRVDLPGIAVQASGVFCQAAIASCVTHSGRYLTAMSDEQTDRPAGAMGGARADAVVVGRSEFESLAEGRVALSGSAQSSFAAVSGVNAARSTVANGVNALAGRSAAGSLWQSNSMMQRR
jgi:hypothetical protein